MSGDSYHIGDQVSMYGGTGNQGIVHNTFGSSGAEPASPELQEAVQELLRLLGDLREQLPPVSARVLDDNLPALTGEAGARQPEERHRALMAVAGIAATVSTVGEPVVEAVRKVLELLAAA
ncbi:MULTISPECIES: DUF5955 family protein [Streptomyces]|uniref:DUF5955 family protein n=1 Tax=Streptomyces mutomycini TaxID=284036 RepID=A0ABW0BCI1_9ACTN|nr:DUF5955 family protein [Streptomyces sp. NRRL S-4]KPC84210.1 hypothetical protein ADK82_05140 [Streptomyces sp. NRRL S-4]